MTAKEFLLQYRTLDDEINAKLEEVARVRALAERVTPSKQGERNGIVSDRVGHGAARLADLEREIDAKIDRLVDLREEIETAIAKVEDERYRLILTERYINGKKWREVSKAVHISDMKWLKKLHGRALEKIIFPP